MRAGVAFKGTPRRVTSAVVLVEVPTAGVATVATIACARIVGADTGGFMIDVDGPLVKTGVAPGATARATIAAVATTARSRSGIAKVVGAIEVSTRLGGVQKSYLRKAAA